MTWGLGQWGLSPWGGVFPASVGTASLLAVSPLIVDVAGGTVLTVTGSNFVAPLYGEVLSGPVGAPVVEGRAFLFDPTFDLKNPKQDQAYTTAILGLPTVPAPGSYHLRLNVAGTLTGILENALTYRVFAEEYKVHKVRKAFGRRWQTGRRLLVTAITGGVE